MIHFWFSASNGLTSLSLARDIVVAADNDDCIYDEFDNQNVYRQWMIENLLS